MWTDKNGVTDGKSRWEREFKREPKKSKNETQPVFGSTFDLILTMAAIVTIGAVMLVTTWAEALLVP